MHVSNELLLVKGTKLIIFSRFMQAFGLSLVHHFVGFFFTLTTTPSKILQTFTQLLICVISAKIMIQRFRGCLIILNKNKVMELM
jgi:hypothetical protein